MLLKEQEWPGASGSGPADPQAGLRRPVLASWLLLGLLLWIAVVFAAYYAVHKPFPQPLDLGAWSLLATPRTGAPLLGSMLDLLVAVWLTGAATGTGHLLLNWWLRQPAPLAFSAAAGLGTLGLAFLALSALGLLAPIPVFFLAGLFTGGAVFGFRLALETGRFAAIRVTRPGPIPLLVGAAALLANTQALTPPTAWDALVYHLAGPRLAIEAGGLVAGLDIPHAYFPGLVEQLFAAAMLIRGDSTAQLMHFVLAVLSVLAVFAFVDGREGRSAAWLAVALLVSVPSLMALARVPYVEWGVILFGFLAFWAMREAIEQDSSRWLLLSGALAGLALGTKYTAVFLVAGTGLALLAGRVHFGSGRLVSTLTWGGTALAVFSPWALRNLVLTGNPVYPFLFGGWNWDAWKAEWFSRPGTGLVTEPWRLLVAPWEVTVVSVQGGGAYDVDTGPLFLALLPLMLLRPPAGWGSHAIAVVAVGYAGWLVGVANSSLLLQGRLLLPVFPFLACLLAVALAHRMPAMPRMFGRARLQPVVHAALLAGLFAGVLGYAARWVADPPIPYLLRNESRNAFLERHLGEYYTVIESLPPDARVLFLWEPRSYHCEATCRPDALLFNWRNLLRLHESPDQVAARLRSDGYTHLLLYGGGLRYFAEQPRPEVEAQHLSALRLFEERHLNLVRGQGLEPALNTPRASVLGQHYFLYELRR